MLPLGAANPSLSRPNVPAPNFNQNDLATSFTRVPSRWQENGSPSFGSNPALLANSGLPTGLSGMSDLNEHESQSNLHNPSPPRISGLGAEGGLFQTIQESAGLGIQNSPPSTGSFAIGSAMERDRESQPFSSGGFSSLSSSGSLASFGILPQLDSKNDAELAANPPVVNRGTPTNSNEGRPAHQTNGT